MTSQNMMVTQGHLHLFVSHGCKYPPNKPSSTETLKLKKNEFLHCGFLWFWSDDGCRTDVSV